MDNPFVGLRPFESIDEEVFFGRRDQTAELLKRLAEHRFVAVVGGSGSGKSSLVKAGLIPVIKRGFLVEDRLAWRQITMRPGVRPLETLALELEKLDRPAGMPQVYFGGSCPERTTLAEPIALPPELNHQRLYQRVVDYLTGRTFPCEKVAGEAAGVAEQHLEVYPAPRAANLLLFVDQFEEVFRYTLSDPDQLSASDARAFVELLLKLATQDGLQVFVVTTMRADFMGACEAFPGLTSMMNRALYLVPRLTRSQLRDAIERPIQTKGGSIAPRLLDRLVNESTDQPHGSRGEVVDQLPVLQHSLMRTWSIWEAGGAIGDIDVTHYERAGTMRGALANHLEQEVWRDLSAAQRVLAEQLFRALTDTDSANRQIRRPTRLSDLEKLTGESKKNILEVLSHFTGSNRSFVTWEPYVDDPMVDISHESLIRKWDRLSAWATTEASEAIVYEQLVQAAALYETQGKGVWSDPNTQPQFASALQLWKSSDVSQAWATRLRLPREAEMLDWDAKGAYAKACEFFAKSRRALDEKVRADEKRRQLAEEDERRMWRWKVGVPAAAVSLLAVGVAAVVWIQNQNSLMVQTGLLPSLVKESATLLNPDPVKSVLIAAEAVRRIDERPFMIGAGQSDSSVAELAVHSLRQALHGWGGEWLGTLPLDASSQIVGLLPAGSRWYAVTRGGEAFTPGAIGLERAFKLKDESLIVTKLDSNGERIAMAVESGAVFICPVASGSDCTKVRDERTPPVSALQFSVEGRWLLIGIVDGSLLAWDTQRETPSGQNKVHSEQDNVHSPAVNLITPYRSGIVTADSNGLSRTWTLSDKGGLSSIPASSPMQSVAVTAMAVNDTDGWLVAGHLDPRVRQAGQSYLQIWKTPAGAGERWPPNPLARLVVPRDLSSQSGEPDVVTNLVITPDRSWLIGVLQTGRVLGYLLKDAQNRSLSLTSIESPVQILPAAEIQSRTLQVSKDGRWLAIQSASDVHLVDLSELRRNPLLGPDAALPLYRTSQALMFTADNHDNHWLVAGLTDGTVRQWNLNQVGSLTRRPIDKISRVALDREGHLFVTAMQSGQVLLADLKADGKRTAASLAFANNPVATLALSRNSQWVLAGDAIGEAVLWKIQNQPDGLTPHMFQRIRGVFAAQFNADGSALWISDQIGKVTRWSLVDDRNKWVEGPSGATYAPAAKAIPPALTLAADRWVIVTKRDENGLALLKILNAEKLNEVFHSDDLNVLAVSPDGRWIITSGAEGIALLDTMAFQNTDAASRQVAPQTLRKGIAPSIAAFSPDGKWLVVGEQSGGVSVYPTTKWSEGAKEKTDLTVAPNVLKASSIQKNVISLAVSPDSHWLMSGGIDSSVLVLDLRRPEAPALRLPVYPGEGVVVAAVFPSGNALVTATDKAVTRQWSLLQDVDRGKVLKEAQTVVGRNFFCDEWKTIFWTLPYRKTFPELPASSCN